MDEFYQTLSTFYNYKIVQDIFTGIYASAAFLLIVSTLKPRIKICNKVAFVLKKDDKDRPLNYYFKIINKSWWFKVYDINVRVYNSKVSPSINGENLINTDIAMRKDRVWFMNRINRWHLFQNIFHGENRLKGRTDYAVLFVTNENLRAMLRSNKCIHFQLIAKHSLTGFTRVISREFKHENEIIAGTFYSGNSGRINKHKK